MLNAELEFAESLIKKYQTDKDHVEFKFSNATKETNDVQDELLSL